jgi:hypothetical protein
MMLEHIFPPIAVQLPVYISGSGASLPPLPRSHHLDPKSYRWLSTQHLPLKILSQVFQFAMTLFAKVL